VAEPTPTRTPGASAVQRLRAAAPRRLGTGAWSYFGDPRAVYAGGRTFVGWTDTRGYTVLVALRGTRLVERVRLGPQLVVDDHNNPALHVRPDGRIMVFYSQHNGGRLYYRISRHPHSIARMSPARAIRTNRRGWWGYTYPNPMRVDGRLWLMFRGADWQPDFTILARGRWTRAQTLVRGPVARDRRLKEVGPGRRHRPYVKYVSDGDRIHGVFSDGCINSFPNTIRYAQFDLDGIRTTRGRLIARLGTAPPVGRLELVRAADGVPQWPLDIAMDAAGHPVLVYLRNTSRPEFWWARFDGTRWRHHMITRYARRPERPGAVGGATLDHETPSVVYLARTTTDAARHEVERWATGDEGRSWRRTPISRSADDDLRPITPLGLRKAEQVIWFAGTRTDWTAFDTRVLITTLRPRPAEASRTQAATSASGLTP
jgi:hypothetical protein